MRVVILLIALISAIVFFPDKSVAAYQFGFGNLSGNYLAWDQSTKDKSTKKDFGYLELEGGAQFDWGDLYGFFDIENFDRAGKEVRTANKGAVHYYFSESKLGIYAQQYTFQSLGFSEQNRVVGLAYTFEGTGWFVKMFLGLHDIVQTYYSGPNGYMGGWIFGYNFNWLNQKFSIFDWHEIEFGRDETVAQGNGGSAGVNGALSIWWLGNDKITPGIQRRYATNKLGTLGDMGAWIASVRINF
jgi:hypothetical protein